jgi:hypothetical protein
MKPLTRRHLLIAAAVLVAVTNAVALGGVAWNRGSPPESTLQLTERELTVAYSPLGTEANSGLSLRLQWRALPNQTDSERDVAQYGAYGAPGWLGESKLAELGFNLSKLSGPRQHRDIDQVREVVLVLEFDGAAYQVALTRARAFAEKTRAELAASPDTKDRQWRLSAAETALQGEERTNSRLFAIDAGLDAAALRARYPDRSRYALMHGRVRLGAWYMGDALPSATITELSVDAVNVPLPMRRAIATQGMYARSEPFEATLAIGKRLEPYLVSLGRGPAR